MRCVRYAEIECTVEGSDASQHIDLADFDSVGGLMARLRVLFASKLNPDSDLRVVYEVRRELAGCLPAAWQCFAWPPIYGPGL